jgi:hypothetical protein
VTPVSYSFNPSLLDDIELRQKISTAIMSIPELTERNDVLQITEASETTVYLVSEETINSIFSSQTDKTIIKEVLEICTTETLRPTLLKEYTFDELLGLVKAKLDALNSIKVDNPPEVIVVD